MLQSKSNNTTIMKRFLIITALSLILLTALGCFDYDNISTPKDSNLEVLAAPAPPPPPEPELYHAEDWVGSNGGTITPGETKAIFPAGALAGRVLPEATNTLG